MLTCEERQKQKETRADKTDWEKDTTIQRTIKTIEKMLTAIAFTHAQSNTLCSAVHKLTLPIVGHTVRPSCCFRFRFS